jgi:hypothetical protein
MLIIHVQTRVALVLSAALHAQMSVALISSKAWHLNKRLSDERIMSSGAPGPRASRPLR